MNNPTNPETRESIHDDNMEQITTLENMNDQKKQDLEKHTMIALWWLGKSVTTKKVLDGSKDKDESKDEDWIPNEDKEKTDNDDKSQDKSFFEKLFGQIEVNDLSLDDIAVAFGLDKSTPKGEQEAIAVNQFFIKTLTWDKNIQIDGKKENLPS